MLNAIQRHVDRSVPALLLIRLSLLKERSKVLAGALGVLLPLVLFCLLADRVGHSGWLSERSRDAFDGDRHCPAGAAASEQLT